MAQQIQQLCQDQDDKYTKRKQNIKEEAQLSLRDRR